MSASGSRQRLPTDEVNAVILENRHTGERLSLRRVQRGSEVVLELKGTLPAHSEGPPLHIHFAEDEEGHVVSGTLAAVVDGRRISVSAGEAVRLPRGSVHRWWNEGDETLEFNGHVRPVVDLDRYLQAVFEVVNASPSGRPSLFYIAHLSLRHRDTQALAMMPRPVQAVLFRVIVAIGTLMGRYRGEAWPGSPSRCQGAPLEAVTEA